MGSDLTDKILGIDPPKVKPLPPPPPIAPLPKPEAGDETTDAQLRRRGKRGRAGTVLTGDLIPEDIGKRTLLG